MDTSAQVCNQSKQLLNLPWLVSEMSVANVKKQLNFLSMNPKYLGKYLLIYFVFLGEKIVVNKHEIHCDVFLNQKGTVFQNINITEQERTLCENIQASPLLQKPLT